MKRRLLRPGCLIAAAGLVLALLAAYALLTGPRDLEVYPPRETSPYRLPWAEGVERLCVQGNRAVVSHRGDDEFSWDFAMPVGSEVRAARGGRVVRVEVSHDGNGFDMPNNLVAIDHGDGTTGSYLHLVQGGALVREGEQVRQGQPIAKSGHVGRSMLPHLHFHVRDGAGKTIAVSFQDVERERGVPRMFGRYVSGNRGRD